MKELLVFGMSGTLITRNSPLKDKTERSVRLVFYYNIFGFFKFDYLYSKYNADSGLANSVTDFSRLSCELLATLPLN